LRHNKEEIDGFMENASTNFKIEQPWREKPESVIDRLEVDPEQGLSVEEVQKRQKKFGKNQLQTEEKKSLIEIALNQFKSLIIGLLAVSAIISFGFGDIIEGLAIVAVIIINAAIGFFTERRAVRSMEALRELTKVTAKVRREGEVRQINAIEIVPGDILALSGGDVITADARLIKESKLRINEASLTGESLPVEKQLEPLSKETPLAERKNMAFKGTAVSRGSAEAAVTRIGMETELGNISSLVQKAEEEVTPLEKRLDALGRKLIYITLGLAAVVAFAGWSAGRDLRLMIETAIALAVAAIPEGLPIVATIALARGMQRMVERNALINKLSSVETLGATSVIITDKTGTLTENQMTVTEIELENGSIVVSGEGLALEGEFKWREGSTETKLTDQLKALIKVGMLCNDASLTFDDGELNQTIGEPMEIALKILGHKASMTAEALKREMPEVRKIAFEQSTKMMATVHQKEEEAYLFAIKGSPEAVFESSTHIATEDGIKDFDDTELEEWQKKNDKLANRGLRVIAFAKKITDDPEQSPYQDLTLLGLVGLMDPPREEVRPALKRCKSAGIRVVMATGDHGETAREIAKAVNLVESEDAPYLLGKDLKEIQNLTEKQRDQYLNTQIFARVDPEQKLDLISLHQEDGQIVAMTGDGVNDAPALKKADIGVAMGQRGTQVAKEAADMVLEDDFFGTIVAAVEQGRAIYNNIQKFVLYLLSCNISEIMVVSLASVINLPLPILPLQILFLNLVTDVFPALALGMGEGDPQLMEEAPRDSDEPIMTKRHWFSMGVFGLLITAAVLLGMTLVLNAFGFSQERATTISFLILAMSQLWHVFDMRKNGTHILKNEITKNKYVWYALILSILLLLGAVYIPFIANILSLIDPGVKGWLVIIVASLAPMIFSQVLKELRLVV
jgi:P-type Ca2+ transporter type 2C